MGNRKSSDSETDKNYQTFKDTIIAFKKDHECTWDIDYIEAVDLAWALAEKLPEGVVLESDTKHTSSNPQGPPDPDWLDRLMTGFLVLAVLLFSYLMYHIITFLL
jgi:hypothetical protein